jgi:hypothetical protein
VSDQSEVVELTMVLHAARISGAHPVVNEHLLRVAERELSHALIAQERPAFGMYAQPSSAADAAFTDAVHVLCDEAHRLDLRAEELLIALKQAWAHLATTRARHLGDRDGDVLREVVTTSIEVFFDARSSPGSDRH